MGSIFVGSSLWFENLIAIIDRNRLQSIENTEKTLMLEPLSEKLKAFNWNVLTIDGHNHENLENVLLQENSSKPTLVIANTIKGKGVSFMENKVVWHYRSPTKADLIKAKSELI